MRSRSNGLLRLRRDVCCITSFRLVGNLRVSCRIRPLTAAGQGQCRGSGRGEASWRQGVVSVFHQAVGEKEPSAAASTSPISTVKIRSKRMYSEDGATDDVGTRWLQRLHLRIRPVWNRKTYTMEGTTKTLD